MFKTILKTATLSATTLTSARLWRDGCSQSVSLLSHTMGKITVLSCGLFVLTNCAALTECLELGDKAFDTPSCDVFTEVGNPNSHPIGGSVESLQGIATYNGGYSLSGSNRVSEKISFKVNFDNKTIAANKNSVSINGSFTEGGVLTGTFNIENDGITAADINGMIGDIGLRAVFDNRSDTADGYLGGFYATREGQLGDQPYRDPDIDYGIAPGTCFGECPLSAEALLTFEARFLADLGERHIQHEDYFRAEANKLEGEARRVALARVTEDAKAIVARSVSQQLERRIISTSRSAEQTRWREGKLWNVVYKTATSAPHAVSINVAFVAPTEFDASDIAVTKTPDATFSLVLGENDTAIATINGVEYEVISNSAVVGGYSPWYIDDPDRKVSDNRVTIWSRGSKRILKGIHPTVQGDYFEYWANTEGLDGNEDGNYVKGFATMGVQTDATVVDSQSAVAIYRGGGSLRSYEALGKSYGYNQDIRLAITMSVDFDANTIEGTGLRTNGGYPEEFDEKVIFNSAPIVDNGFEGTFTLNSEWRKSFGLTDNPTGQYRGNFFGPNADDLAGVMSFDGVDTDGIGGFRADRTVISGFKE